MDNSAPASLQRRVAPKSSASLAFLRVIRLVRVLKLTKHSVGLQVRLLYAYCTAVFSRVASWLPTRAQLPYATRGTSRPLKLCRSYGPSVFGPRQLLRLVVIFAEHYWELRALPQTSWLELVGGDKRSRKEKG